MGAGGKSGQVFADLQSADGCGDGLKIAADFERRVGFHIEGVVMTDGACAEHEDQGFGAGSGCFGAGGSSGPGMELAKTAGQSG